MSAAAVTRGYYSVPSSTSSSKSMMTSSNVSPGVFRVFSRCQVSSVTLMTLSALRPIARLVYECELYKWGYVATSMAL